MLFARRSTKKEMTRAEGRSPMMRHESRTHRVSIVWLFHRISFNPKIQIKHVDTKSQLAADLLTEGSFTRDEWCNLLRLVNMLNFSMFSRTHVRSVEKATVIQERKMEGEPAVAKPRSVCF